ncbi:cyclic-phosphate processing receiver domain-containing protein [Paenibacillus sp. NPDC056579]|uniref:cyclic-phosphate processing receiver domain-containing protein n=1 Tax=Paenibacillus sp. NPDC056579 TaxID=3345871 RepID=UPI003687371A
MINVFLDDLRPRPKGYKLARSARECIRYVKDGNINVLSLDYNLGTDKPTGYRVVKYMIEKGTYPRKIILHTATYSGRVRMYKALEKHKPESVTLVVKPRRQSHKSRLLRGR